ASAVFWIFTLASISVNSWFNLYRDAFSDLGGSRARDPWIYNLGLVTSSIFIELLSIRIVLTARNKLEVVSGSYLSIAGVFLTLIAVYPAGTRPHVFVSTWFFIQAFLGVLLHGIAVISRDRVFSILTIIIFTLALAGALVDWPSAACLETYEILLLTLYTTLYAVRSS
ncbi:MAG: DUF998 domain-containing protein, partial [Sulfolobales archaeon]